MKGPQGDTTGIEGAWPSGYKVWGGGRKPREEESRTEERRARGGDGPHEQVEMGGVLMGGSMSQRTDKCPAHAGR